NITYFCYRPRENNFWNPCRSLVVLLCVKKLCLPKSKLVVNVYGDLVTSSPVSLPSLISFK
ncbi:unnamed protein product, partial [Schistosoma turkestanicum]